MTAISTPDFAPIYEAIAKTNQRYAPKVLNQILRQLYKASYTGTGAESVVAVELSHMDELPPNKKCDCWCWGGGLRPQSNIVGTP